MTISCTTDMDHIDWDQLAALFVRANLGNRSAEVLEATFRSSQATVFILEDGHLIGAGRALSDHIAWSVIFDVAIDPAHQGKGLGATLMQKLLDEAGTPNVMLKSMPGKESFYAKFGFRLMPTGMEANGNADIVEAQVPHPPLS